jgi:hypothetical protein
MVMDYQSRILHNGLLIVSEEIDRHKDHGFACLMDIWAMNARAAVAQCLSVSPNLVGVKTPHQVTSDDLVRNQGKIFVLAVGEWTGKGSVSNPQGLKPIAAKWIRGSAEITRTFPTILDQLIAANQPPVHTLITADADRFLLCQVNLHESWKSSAVVLDRPIMDFRFAVAGAMRLH